MTIDDLNVRIGICEDILKQSRLNEFHAMLEELYEKSEFFRDLVETYDCIDEGTPKENVIGSIMYDLEETL